MNGSLTLWLEKSSSVQKPQLDINATWSGGYRDTQQEKVHEKLLQKTNSRLDLWKRSHDWLFSYLPPSRQILWKETTKLHFFPADSYLSYCISSYLIPVLSPTNFSFLPGPEGPMADNAQRECCFLLSVLEELFRLWMGTIMRCNERIEVFAE